MLLTSGSLLLSDPGAFLAMLIAIVTALLAGITVHEFSHALVAYRLGDATAAQRGRLSLNPRAHLDPMGTIMVLVAGFGWGKPVPVDPSRLRTGRQGMALVSLAGPIANVLVASVFALPFHLGLLTIPQVWPPRGLDLGLLPAYIAFVGVFLNMVLSVFNLLPIYPLDGSSVLLGATPERWVPTVSRLQLFGPVLLISVILLDIAFGYGLLWRIVGPVVNWGTTVLLG